MRNSSHTHQRKERICYHPARIHYKRYDCRRRYSRFLGRVRAQVAPTSLGMEGCAVGLRMESHQPMRLCFVLRRLTQWTYSMRGFRRSVRQRVKGVPMGCDAVEMIQTWTPQMEHCALRSRPMRLRNRRRVEGKTHRMHWHDQSNPGPVAYCRHRLSCIACC